MAKNRFERRIEALRGLLAREDADGLYVIGEANVSYLTGRSGADCSLWISRTDAVILTDFRYREMAQELFWLDLEETGPGRREADILASICGGRIGVERNTMTLASWLDLREKAGEDRLAVIGGPDGGPVEALRMIKDADEIEKIRRAEALACEAFSHMLGVIAPGKTEKQLARELDRFLLDSGASSTSFDTICLAGANASRPHGVPSDKPVERGEFLLMDFGCVLDGYCSDMTRTVAVGGASPEMREVYGVVLDAQLAACGGIKAGMTGAQAHAVAAGIIAGAGYGENFGHGLGHGVGLQIHEAPRFSPTYPGQIPENCVCSVEPGIYLPKKFGVRIEDLAIVGRDGIINLNGTAPKELIII